MDVGVNCGNMKAGLSKILPIFLTVLTIVKYYENGDKFQMNGRRNAQKRK